MHTLLFLVEYCTNAGGWYVVVTSPNCGTQGKGGSPRGRLRFILRPFPARAGLRASVAEGQHGEARAGAGQVAVTTGRGKHGTTPGTLLRQPGERREAWPTSAHNPAMHCS